MKIFIICSKAFYKKIPKIKKELEQKGHKVTLPNCFENPETEAKYRNLGFDKHSKWKSSMIKHSEKVIKKQDAVLVLNFTKNKIKNYIGGATFLEMYDAFRLKKKIYLYNELPKGILKDEIIGFSPILIKKDFSKIK